MFLTFVICLRKWIWAEAESGQSRPRQVREGRGRGEARPGGAGGQVIEASDWSILVILSSDWSGTSPSSSRAGRTEQVSSDGLR